MPFQIVVDGYNVIGSEQGLRGDLERKRAELIEEVARYQARTGHVLTAVFDGWRAGRRDETTQRVGNVTVVFSRYGEKADAVIERLAREMGSACVVVTSDRDLRRSVVAGGAVAAVYVGEFIEKMRTDPATDPSWTDEEPEPPPRPPGDRKKGNPEKLSKEERKRREVLKKL